MRMYIHTYMYNVCRSLPIACLSVIKLAPKPHATGGGAGVDMKKLNLRALAVVNFYFLRFRDNRVKNYLYCCIGCACA